MHLTTALFYYSMRDERDYTMWAGETEDFNSNGAEYLLPRLKMLRIGAKLSINKLASEAGVSRDLVSSLERGHPHTLLKVQAVFDVLSKHHSGLTSNSDIFHTKETRKS